MIVLNLVMKYMCKRKRGNKIVRKVLKKKLNCHKAHKGSQIGWNKFKKSKR